MKKLITRFLTFTKVLYVKWIMGECRHFCCVCKFHNQCFDNLEYDVLKRLEDDGK